VGRQGGSEEGEAMLYEHLGRRPRVDPTSRVAPNAVLCGEVTVGPNCSIGFGAVLSAESGPITVGANCVIMDTAVIRGVRRNPVTIGDNVLVGPRAYLSGCAVEADAFLATGATVFNGARIGARAEVRINGIVHLRSALAEGAVVPIGWIAVGDPAHLFPPERHAELWERQRELDFPGTVFGLGREEATMDRIAERYAELFGRHREDRIIDP
jgi:carbonic anhydrase/acetyltransferase-like protein (isoleucine patch superfamily)